MKYLLDTCVVSELISKQPNSDVIEFVDGLDPEDVFLSVITVGEIAKGIEKLPKSRRKQDLLTWLEEELLIRFEGNIISLDIGVLMRWGELAAKLEGVGVTLPAIDALIAATALTHNMTIVTRNESDFENTGVEIINPWRRR
ncbi:MAG: VapC toxin family PIN domain ribonuclease [Chloroflexi bacterium]|nr:type II toxin-antitoxin system VapC family toxin [Chloroflexi bacterium CFX1]MCK6567953.1 type II toxin-antitoxin system VapC family toxin [Anaerolineales bacterium]MCQ3953390.1 VapC toxin family PIN domain ribonuclease [Chloroflexota bacterium]MDL1919620.1 type II toxin-antitoxin system VapC family toxin [Chloroflexi bacterium CFX5]NUQ59370.1 type II toxin-antitoxin system VapC family toxin [Anaerolineales bacterium]